MLNKRSCLSRMLFFPSFLKTNQKGRKVDQNPKYWKNGHSRFGETFSSLDGLFRALRKERNFQIYLSPQNEYERENEIKCDDGLVVRLRALRVETKKRFRKRRKRRRKRRRRSLRPHRFRSRCCALRKKLSTRRISRRRRRRRRRGKTTTTVLK